MPLLDYCVETYNSVNNYVERNILNGIHKLTMNNKLCKGNGCKGKGCKGKHPILPYYQQNPECPYCFFPKKNN